MNGQRDLKETLVESETVFQGNYLNLNRLKVQLPDGRLAQREIVQVRDAVAILPIDSCRNVYLVRQYRPAIERTVLEIPAGLIDSGESRKEAAIRECREETGMKPGHVEEMVTYAHAMGYSTGFITLFLGMDLEDTGQIELDESEDLDQIVMPFDELIQLVENNQIVDPKTILAVMLGKEALGE